jgi:hypothetical protein
MLRKEHEQVSARGQTRSSSPRRILGRDIFCQEEGARTGKSPPLKIPPTIRKPSMNRLLDPIASALPCNLRAGLGREKTRILNNPVAFVESACAQDGKIKTP